MKLAEKYISRTENEIKEDLTRIVLTDEAYAVCEFIEQMIDKLEHARMSMITRK